MRKEKQWIFPDEDICRKSITMAQDWNIPVVFAQILLSRGISEKEQARRFLKPSLDRLYDPFLMDGIEQSVGRLIEARQKRLFILFLR